MITSGNSFRFLQSTTAGMQLSVGRMGMCSNGLGSMRAKCFPGLSSCSRSPSSVLKITSKEPSRSQSTTRTSSVVDVSMSLNAKKGLTADASRTKCLSCPRQPVRLLVSHHQAYEHGRRKTNARMASKLGMVSS